MKVSALKARVRKVDVVIPATETDPEECVWIMYKPGEFTIEIAEKVNELVAEGKDNEVISEMLLPVLDAWDLEDEEGNQLPVTLETMKTIPLHFLMACITTITEDARPDPQKGGTSEDGSVPADSQDPAQNGTSSFA